uniref:Endonuclease/exonuclease/phosphatase domain-containing protein n=1 Tax=Erpetoichthys calabaricus TaxID=27687 RepID=A0A8C4S1N0_ERPCA
MGNLFNCKVILINIYASNVDYRDFIHNVLASILNVNTHKIVMAGDFNCVLNPDLDRSSATVATTSNNAKTITQFVIDHNLSDQWRFLNPNLRLESLKRMKKLVSLAHLKFLHTSPSASFVL